jgi:hypothetical protein
VDVVDGELNVDWVSKRVFEIKPKLEEMVLLEKAVVETKEVTVANGFGSEGQHRCKS